MRGGLAYFDLGEVLSAVSDYTQAIALDPGSHLAYCNRRKLRSQMGDSGGAILDFDQALTIADRDLSLTSPEGHRIDRGLIGWPMM